MKMMNIQAPGASRRSPGASLMNQSAARRVASAVVPVILLWLAVAWAMSAP
jgi:hypothetical protein